MNKLLSIIKEKYNKIKLEIAMSKAVDTLVIDESDEHCKCLTQSHESIPYKVEPNGQK